LASAAFSGAVGATNASDVRSEIPFQDGGDPDLRLLVEVWAELPNSVKNQILKLVDDAAARVW
jgi:hypothetical protein